jgi:hypothetical protein
MERQALRDAVVRYSAEGLSGLRDRPHRRASKLTEGQQAALRALILRAPIPNVTASRRGRVPTSRS